MVSSLDTDKTSSLVLCIWVAHVYLHGQIVGDFCYRLELLKLLDFPMPLLGFFFVCACSPKRNTNIESSASPVWIGGVKLLQKHTAGGERVCTCISCFFGSSELAALLWVQLNFATQAECKGQCYGPQTKQEAECGICLQKFLKGWWMRLNGSNFFQSFLCANAFVELLQSTYICHSSWPCDVKHFDSLQRKWSG